MNEPYSIAKVQLRDALRKEYQRMFDHPPSSDPISIQFDGLTKDGFKSAVLAIAATISEDREYREAFYHHIIGV